MSGISHIPHPVRSNLDGQSRHGVIAHHAGGQRGPPLQKPFCLDLVFLGFRGRFGRRKRQEERESPGKDVQDVPAYALRLFLIRAYAASKGHSLALRCQT